MLSLSKLKESMSVSSHAAATSQKERGNAISSETHEIFICVYTNESEEKKPTAERNFASVMKTYQVES